MVGHCFEKLVRSFEILKQLFDLSSLIFYIWKLVAFTILKLLEFFIEASF